MELRYVTRRVCTGKPHSRIVTQQRYQVKRGVVRRWRARQSRGSRSGLLVTIQMVSVTRMYSNQQLMHADILSSIEICGNEQFILGRDPALW
jgi:hypothetical protein